MKIQFKTVQGDNFAFEFEPSDTVRRSLPMAGIKNVPRSHPCIRWVAARSRSPLEATARAGQHVHCIVTYLAWVRLGWLMEANLSR
jgi:hypothetical protein